MSDTLGPNQQLSPGQSIRSQDGRFEFIMQQDGNLVLYQPGAKPLWAANTTGLPVIGVIMQNDGNLVIYVPGQAGSRPVWASNTGKPGSGLVVQNDGNLVIYHEGQSVWTTATALNSPAPAGFPPTSPPLTEQQNIVENLRSIGGGSQPDITGNFGLLDSHSKEVARGMIQEARQYANQGDIDTATKYGVGAARIINEQMDGDQADRLDQHVNVGGEPVGFDVGPPAEQPDHRDHPDQTNRPDAPDHPDQPDGPSNHDGE